MPVPYTALLWPIGTGWARAIRWTRKNIFQISGDCVTSRFTSPAAARSFPFDCCRVFALRAKTRQQQESPTAVPKANMHRSLRSVVFVKIDQQSLLVRHDQAIAQGHERRNPAGVGGEQAGYLTDALG